MYLSKIKYFGKYNIYDRISIVFCASEKTAAFGVPLIATLYSHDDNVGLYTVPLLLFHPMQLIVDSFLVGPLQKRSHAYKITTKMQTSITQNEDINDNFDQIDDDDDDILHEDVNVEMQIR